MSKIIRVESGLLLFALKYALLCVEADKGKVINNIYANMDDLTDEELNKYMKTLDTNKIPVDDVDMFNELKKRIEKELWIRQSVSELVAGFKKSDPTPWRPGRF